MKNELENFSAAKAPSTLVSQTGEKNVYANHVATMNIFVQGESTVTETTGTLSAIQDSICFGNIEISPEDYQLLEEFKNCLLYTSPSPRD